MSSASVLANDAEISEFTKAELLRKQSTEAELFRRQSTSVARISSAGSVGSQEDEQQDEEDVELDADLTPTELGWIVATRDAAKAAGFAPSNALLVQLAVITKGRTHRALRRLEKLKRWEEDPMVVGMTHAQAHTEVNDTASPSQRGFCAAVRRATNGSLAFAADYGSYYPGDMRLPVAIRAVIGTFEATCCSLEDVRRGVTIVINCNGVGYSNISLTAEYAISKLYVEGYPVRIGRIVLLDVTLVARLALKAIRRVLPRKMNSRIHVISHDELSTLFARSALPAFLDGTDPPNADEWWAALHAKRAAWEAELVATYGPGFDKL